MKRLLLSVTLTFLFTLTNMANAESITYTQDGKMELTENQMDQVTAGRYYTGYFRNFIKTRVRISAKASSRSNGTNPSYSISGGSVSYSLKIW